MLSVFVPTSSVLKKIDNIDVEALPPDAIWIDLKSPSPGEDKAVERLVGIEIPTREDMQEIEISSRLYIENNARYMTATLMCAADSQVPRTTPVTFILADHRLVTVRYDEPKPFALIAAKLARSCPSTITGDAVLLELLDAVIDRCAGTVRPDHDVIERHQDRLAIEVRGGDLVGRAEKVIGGHHGHRDLLVERDDGQSGRIGRRPEHGHVDRAGPHCGGGLRGDDGAQLQRGLGMPLHPDPGPLRGRPNGYVPEGERAQRRRSHGLRLPIG